VPGVINGCVIHLEPRLVIEGDFSDADVRAVLIHELMHCFLDQQFGVRYDKMPAWYVEGVPTWVASVRSGDDPVGDDWWIAYLSSDSFPLFKRSYSAMGFYTHLADVGTDPWSVILPIGQAFIASGYSNLAGWKASGVNTDFLDSWGSGYAEGRYPGTAWATGTNLPRYQPDLGPVEPVTDTTVLNIGAPADASTLRQLDVDAPIIEITTSSGANGRISLGGSADTTLDHTAGVNYCSDATGCVCPSTSPQANATFTHIDSGIEYASIAGDTADATMTLIGMSLPTFCASSCPAGSATGGVIPAGTYDGIIDTTVITEVDEDGLLTGKGTNRVRGPVHLVSNGTTVQGYMRISGGIGVSIHLPVGGTSKSYAADAVGTISGPASSPIVVVSSDGRSTSPVGLHLTQISCAGISGDMAAVFPSTWPASAQRWPK
jgi:hypothetical protein